MASLLAPIRAFDLSKRFIKQMPLETVQLRVLDDVNKAMWMAAPWRWTVGTTTAITLVSNQQDYTSAPPADFLYLLASYISDGSGVTRHLKIVPSLPPSVIIKGMPDLISYQGSNTFRLSPNPGTQIAPTKQIISWYKKQAPVFTASNVYTPGTQVFDDEWFYVFVEGVLWRSYLYGDDQRAGGAQIDIQGRVTYTGQKAVFEAGLQNMREREPLMVFENRVALDQEATK